MVKKILLVVVLLPFLILMLSPKKEIFYLFEKQLADRGIVISDGTISEHPFGLTIEHPALYFKGAKVATAREITLWSVLAYTRGSIDGLVTDPSLKNYLPEKVDKISVVHSIASPFIAPVTLQDTSYGGEGEIRLKERRLKIRFPHLPAKSPMTRYLKHTKGGWTYEQRF